MRTSIVSLAVLTALTAATTAAAEDMYRGAWYAVPGASYMNTDNDLDADNGRGGSLAIGKELSESWDLQGRLGYNRADEDLGLPGASGKYKQTTLGLDALYMLSRSNFRPFLLAGLGAGRNDADYKATGLILGDKKTSWLAGLGLGAQYLFNDNFGIQADLRHQWSRAKLELQDPARGLSSSSTETIGNTLFNVGALFRFGAPAAVPAAVVEDIVPEPLPVIEPAPQPMVEPIPQPIACQPSTQTITIDAEKLFTFDSANLTALSFTSLDEVAAKIKSDPSIISVLVTGHTDRFGSEAYNLRLSQRRAQKVAEYLVSQGVNGSLVSSEGKGESQPIVQCEGRRATKKVVSCLQPNRRVEIRAEGTKQVGCQ